MFDVCFFVFPSPPDAWKIQQQKNEKQRCKFSFASWGHAQLKSSQTLKKGGIHTLIKCCGVRSLPSRDLPLICGTLEESCFTNLAGNNEHPDVMKGCRRMRGCFYSVAVCLCVCVWCLMVGSLRRVFACICLYVTFMTNVNISDGVNVCKVGEGDNRKQTGWNWHRAWSCSASWRSIKVTRRKLRIHWNESLLSGFKHCRFDCFLL